MKRGRERERKKVIDELVVEWFGYFREKKHKQILQEKIKSSDYLE